jgi:protoporphyrinogen IX oxidase
MSDSYSLFKALHLIADFAWMAGLFYLPRLFVYHSKAPVGGETSELFKVMERRLLAAIMRPAALAAWVFGLLTAWYGGVFTSGGGWWHVKFASVVLLTAFHGLLESHKAQFARDERLRSERYFRVINEVPTLLLIVIVLMAVLKPF